jgi:hypothetical protein
MDIEKKLNNLIKSQLKEFPIKVGIVGFYNNLFGFGIICEHGNPQFIRYIINNKSLKISKGDIVLFSSNELMLKMDGDAKVKSYVGYSVLSAYSVEEKLDAIQLLIEDDQKYDRRFNEHFIYSDKYLLGYQNNTLFQTFVEEKLFPYKTLLNQIYNHVDNTDFQTIFENYSVSVTKGGRNKPGDDDSAWAYIQSSTLPRHFEFDLYLNDLFPLISIKTFEDSGFTPYGKMLELYNSSEDEIEAEKLNLSIKFRAKTFYSKEDHLSKLKKGLIAKIDQIQNEYRQLCKIESMKMIQECINVNN